MIALALAYAVGMVASAQTADAAEPPPGGLVSSATNFGWTKGDFSVSEDGAAQYSIPLWAPQGRGKSTPMLALSYSSRAGNGPLGVGWSVAGLPSITQCPRTRAQHGHAEGLLFDGSGTWCLGGNRLIALSSSSPEREFRTERETYSKIIGYGMQDGVPDYFKVWGKDGLILTLGQAASSREQAFRLMYAPGGLRRESARVILAWAVNRIEDRNGNAAVVEYVREEGNADGLWYVDMRPSVILYQPNRRIQFNWETETRPDPVDGFAAGVHTRNPYRLASISMHGGPQGGTAEKLREYRLGYADNTNTGRSLLTEVKECDGPGVCKLPLQLTYSRGSDSFDAVDLTSITDVGTSAKSGHQVHVIDINGDGKDDLLYPDAQNNWKIRRSTTNGFAGAVGAGIPRVDAQTKAQIKLIDFDLDGRTDAMAEVPDTSLGGTGWKLYRSDGSKFVAFTQNIGFFGNQDDELDPIYFGDLDGNGTPDFLTAAYDTATDEDDFNRIDGPWRYRLNDGSRFSAEVNTQATAKTASAHPTRNNVADLDGDGRAELIGKVSDPGGPNSVAPFALGLDRGGQVETTRTNLHSDNEANLGDFNGDGLIDELTIRQEAGTTPPQWRISAAISSGGNGVAPGDRINFPRPVEANAVRVVDVDSDGRQDVLLFAPNAVSQYRWADGKFERRALDVSVGTAPATYGYAATQPLDFDGDGAMDLIDVADGHLRLLRRKAGPADRLEIIGQQFAGPVVELSYTTAADRTVHTAGDCAYPLYCPTREVSIVSRHRVATYAAKGAEWDTYDHTYRAGRMDLLGRGFLGFAEHRVTRALTGAVTVSEFDNVSRGAGLHLYPGANAAHKVTHTVTDRPRGRESRSTTVNQDVPKALGAGRYTVERQTVTQTEEERPVGSGTWQSLRKNSTTVSYDAFGNAAKTVSATTGGRVVTQDPTFRNDTGNWLIGLPTRQSTTACTAEGECTTRVSTADYNDKGDLIEGVVEPNQPALKQTTTMAYGPFGVVQSVTRTDNAGQARTQRFEYANNDRLHPTATLNALGHRTQFQTHSGLGVVLRTVDPNGVPATNRYDGFGRLRETHGADGSFERIDHGFFLAQIVTTTDSSGRSTTAVIDPLGRDLEMRVKAFDGRTATTFTEYDPLGRVARASRPVFSGETRRYSAFTYDNRGRLLSSTAPDGVVIRHEYIGRETHTIDGTGTKSYAVSTVDGDIMASYEDNPSTTGWLRTRFEYDGFGDITLMVGPDGTEKTFRYDRLGRRDRLVDPSTGTSTTTYNAFGEVISETDGSGRTTTYATDLLGRVTTTTSPDGTATNTWDTAARGIGNLASAQSADGVRIRHTYDGLGRPDTSTYTIEGTQYTYGQGYDEVGRPASLTYPAVPGAPANAGRLKVEYVYNEHGYLRQVKDAAGGPAYWTAQDRNAEGQLSAERYGNGVVTERTYEPATGLLHSTTATGPGNVGRVFDMVVSRDDDRNISGRTDRVAGRQEVYGYDALNRLVSWRLQVANPLSVTTTDYTYDKAGNLKTERVGGHPDRNATYGYGQNGAPPHAVSTRNGQAYGYDGAGRQVSGPGRTVAYNSAGLPTSINWGQNQRTEFAYDPNGARAHKEDASATVVYAGALFERRTSDDAGGTGIQNLHNVVADGRVVAQVNRIQAAGGGAIVDTRVSYVTVDHQGSTGKVTNASGRPSDDAGFLGELFYDPFGRRTDIAGAPLGTQSRGGPRQGFTGHYHDDEYGLINMKGRWYDPESRRFLTPDPFISNVAASQTHNRYSYVANNPLTLTDPSGLLIIEGGDTRSGGSSGVGSWWQGNTSAFLGGSTIPFSAPLTTHAPDMARAGGRSPGGGSGVADDDSTATRTGDNGYKSGDSEAPGLVINTLSDDATQIGNSFFWQVGNQHWVLLPGESSPRMVTSEQWIDAIVKAVGGTGTSSQPSKPMHIADAGPYTITGETFSWSEPKFGFKAGGGDVDPLGKASTSGPSYSFGGTFTLGKIKAKAEFAGGQAAHTMTVEGPSVGASAKVNQKGFKVGGGVAAGAMGTCLKVCTPVVRYCAEACGGAKLGIGADITFGITNVKGKLNPGLVEVGAAIGHEAVIEREFSTSDGFSLSTWLYNML